MFRDFYLTFSDTPLVGTGVLRLVITSRISAPFLVGIIPAIVLMIALPRFEDAPPVAAPVFDGSASVERAVPLIFIRVVPAIVVTIASPEPRDAFPIGAVELVPLAGQILPDAHPIIVHQFGRFVALALGRPVDRRMTRLGASAIIQSAGIELATLSIRRKHL